MADTFDPAEFSAFKAQAAPPPAAGGFDPAEFAATKTAGISIHPVGSPEMSQTEKGAKGLGRGLAGFIGDLGEAAMGPFGPSHHAGNLMADLGLGERPKPEAPYGAQIAHGTGIEDPKPGYTGTIGEFLGNPASYFGPGGLLRKWLMAVGSGAGSEAAGEAAEDTGLEGPARTAGALIAGPLAARTLKPQLAPAQQALADAGVTQMTPGQLIGGFAKGVEDKLSSVPILGDFINSGRRRSVESFNKAVANQALEPIGERLERGTPAGHEMVAEVEQKLGAAYDTLKPRLQFIPDRQYANDLNHIWQNEVQLLPQPQIDQFERILAAKLGPPAPINGTMFKKIESELTNLGSRYGASSDAAQRDMGYALRNVVQAMRSNLERSNPAHANELANMNYGWAMFARMQDAAANTTGAGVFMPSQLLSAVKRGDRTVRHGSFARGDALMQDFAEAGQKVLPSKVPDSGTPGRLMASIAAGGGLGYLSPKVLAGIGAASTPYLRPSMALLNRYVRPTTGVRSAISDVGRGAGMLRPFMQGPYPFVGP
jgi:hypothetical protein